MGRFPHFAGQVSVAILLLLMSGISLVYAQGRMNDKDVESLMKNLQEDAKKFRSSFDSAVGKSTIRKTSQEKDAKALVERFQKETEGMLNQFKNKKKSDALPSVVATADQIDKLLTATQMGSQTDADWAHVKTELSALSQQFDTAAQPR